MAHQNLPEVVTIPHGAMVGESSINPPFASLKERDQIIHDNLEEAGDIDITASQAHVRNTDMVSFQHAIDIAQQTRDTLNNVPDQNGQELLKYRITTIQHSYAFPQKGIQSMNNHSHGIEINYDDINGVWAPAQSIWANPNYRLVNWGAGITSFERDPAYAGGPYNSTNRYRWYGYRFGFWGEVSAQADRLIIRAHVSYARYTNAKVWTVWRKYQ